MATEQLFQQMIDLRSSVVRDLMEWLDKTVTVSWAMGHDMGPNWGAHPCLLVTVTARFCTFRSADGAREKSEPTDWLTFGWDDRNARPQIFVNPTMVNGPRW